MNSPVQDPRDIITPDAYAVAPHLLGLPLAKPWRRGVAMLLDLLLVALLVNAGGVFFGVAAAVIFFRMSRRPAGSAAGFRRPARFAFRSVAALALFVTCVSLWGKLQNSTEDRAVDALASEDPAGAVKQVRAALLVGADLKELQRATSDAEAEAAARRAATRLEGTGTERSQIPDALRDIAEDLEGDTLAVGALRAVADSLGSEPAPSAATAEADSILRAYVAALDGDTATAVRLRRRAVSTLAEDTLAALRRRVDQLELQNVSLRRAVEDAEESSPGVLHLIRVVADEMGLGFGWVGLYFTAFIALWRGQTPGKRLLGLRVLRLNGAPIGWWASFERFGGYAAGLLTGLLGFAQIWWDRNRQAIHDKISETVVVQE